MMPPDTYGQPGTDTVRLSVLMVTYGGDSADDLDAALKSLACQTRPADEIVLVRNGPLGADLAAVIGRWRTRLPLAGPVLPENTPFPRALNAGLDACTGDLVARMDSDDVCRPERFEVQSGHMQRNPTIDVLGSAIEEFDTDPGAPHRTRTMPLAPDAIRHVARWRNPMNHMTVMFRRAAVVDAGCYRDLPGFEDYELWVRLMASGRRLENLPDHLVAARIGNGFLRRRRGLRYARAEWRAMSAIASHRLPGATVIWLSRPVRFALRCLPAPLAGLAYGPLRRATAPGPRSDSGTGGRADDSSSDAK